MSEKNTTAAPAQFYRLTLQGSNPRGIPPIEVAGELRQGVILRTPNKPGRIRYQLVDAAWFDALREQDSHIWEGFAATAIRTAEGPYPDDAEGLFFNGDPVPYSLDDSEHVYRTNNIDILRECLPHSPSQANLIRRCMRILAAGGSESLQRYIWGRNVVTQSQKVEDPTDAGYMRSEVWLSYPHNTATPLPTGPQIIGPGL